MMIAVVLLLLATPTCDRSNLSKDIEENLQITVISVSFIYLPRPLILSTLAELRELSKLIKSLVKLSPRWHQRMWIPRCLWLRKVLLIVICDFSTNKRIETEIIVKKETNLLTGYGTLCSVVLQWRSDGGGQCAVTYIYIILLIISIIYWSTTENKCVVLSMIHSFL